MLSRLARLLPGAALACTLLLGAGPALANDRLDEAHRHWRAHNWAKAEAAFRSAAEADSAGVVALAHYLDETGRASEGHVLAQKALRIAPDNSEAVVTEIECLGDTGRYKEAIEAAERALARLEPGKKASRALLSRLHLTLAGAQGTAAEKDGLMAMLKYAFSVKQHIDKSIELDPNSGRAWYGRGIYHRDAPSVVGGNPAKGLQDLEKAHRLAPDAFDIWAALIATMAQQGDGAGVKRETERYEQAFVGLPPAAKELKRALSKPD